jgi:hypothetical protein
VEDANDRHLVLFDAIEDQVIAMDLMSDAEMRVSRQNRERG